MVDGMNLAPQLVKQGWYSWHRKYAPEDTVLERLEAGTSQASHSSPDNDPLSQ